MQITSITPDTVTKSRAKKDAIVASAPAAKKPKPRSRRKANPEPTVQVDKSSAAPAITDTPANLVEKIAVAAYFIAAQRNFSPGHELDDWLAAEQMVLSRQAA
jgi:hypothetical protein